MGLRSTSSRPEASSHSFACRLPSVTWPFFRLSSPRAALRLGPAPVSTSYASVIIRIERGDQAQGNEPHAIQAAPVAEVILDSRNRECSLGKNGNLCYIISTRGIEPGRCQASNKEKRTSAKLTSNRRAQPEMAEGISFI
jgi:hypothetical protein